MQKEQKYIPSLKVHVYANAAGFEPTRAMPKRFLVLRLNHSARHPSQDLERLQAREKSLLCKF